MGPMAGLVMLRGLALGSSLHAEPRAVLHPGPLPSFALAPHPRSRGAFPTTCAPPRQPQPPTPTPSAHPVPTPEGGGICIARGLWFLTPDLPAATGIPYRSVTQLTERETMAFYISPGYQEPALSELCFSISLTLHCASLYQLQC